MWWSSGVPYHLPYATGSHLPGCMDIMVDYSRDGLFTRAYYPTEKTTSIETHHDKWIPWIPFYDYIVGFAKVILVPAWIIQFVIWWRTGTIHIPALYGAKVNTQNKLKCIIFSPGYGASRFFYSISCCELASRGYIVFVIEHRDETACHTYYYKSKEDVQNDKKTDILHKKVPVGGGHYEERNEQVRFRKTECSKLLDFVLNLNKNIISPNILDDLSGADAYEFKLKDLVGNIDTDNLIMGGQSFGGATALLTLAERKEFKCGILLDAWMFSIKNEETLPEKITAPLLFINTQTFHISVNIKSLAKLERSDRQMVSILHTTHESQTDSVTLAGYWLNWGMKKMDGLKCIRINNALMLRFLKEQTGHPENVTDCDQIINKEKHNLSYGLPKPWA